MNAREGGGNDDLPKVQMSQALKTPATVSPIGDSASLRLFTPGDGKHFTCQVSSALCQHHVKSPFLF